MSDPLTAADSADSETRIPQPLETAGDWRWQPSALRALVEGLGYDVAEREGGDPVSANSLTARRERGGRAHLVVVDAGGRLRAEVTFTEDETAGATRWRETDLRLVRVTRRETTISGQLVDHADLRAILLDLDRLASGGSNERLDRSRRKAGS